MLISSTMKCEFSSQSLCIIAGKQFTHTALVVLIECGLLFLGNYGAPGGFWYDPWSQDDPIMVLLLA